MSNVTVSIGGRQYTVACATGEEEHIELLGRSIDGKLQGLTNLSGQSEARTLLFAALLLADELHERDLAGGPDASAIESDMADALEAAAGRLEEFAARLEVQAPPS